MTAPQSIGTCLACDYDLRGLQSRNCPECGREFDRDNPLTMGAPEIRLGELGRWAISRPHPMAWVLTVIAGSIVLWYARFPLEVRCESNLYRWVWSAMIVYWGARIGLQMCSRIRMRRCAARHEILTAPSSAVCIGAMLLAVLVRAEVLSSVAMRLSNPAMERIAAEVRGDGEAYDFPKTRWAGLYLIRGGQYLENRPRVDRDTYLYSAELKATFTYCSSDSVRSCLKWYSRYLTSKM